MRHFFKDELEPFSYLIYLVAISFTLYRNPTLRRKILLGYYACAAILIFAATNKINEFLNRTLYNTFFLLTVVTFYYYFSSLMTTKKAKLLVNLIVAINILVFAADLFLSQQLVDIKNHFYATIYLSIVVYVLLYFHQVLNNINENNILCEFDFYLASGYLIYFLSCFFIILFYEEVEVNSRALVWSIQNSILCLGSIITLTGSLWIRKRCN